MEDSRPATEDHRRSVAEKLEHVRHDLDQRAYYHDKSKMRLPEVEVFDEFTPKLRDCTYGSEEYKGFLAAMKPALDHHYKANRHHPEHFVHGVDDMTLMDLIEMLADWKAASERHVDGDIQRSIDLNVERFGLSEQLAEILRNTVREWGKWI